MDFLGNVNLFHGRAALQLAMGEDTDRRPPERIFVRPHELEVSRENDGKPTIRGKVSRIRTAGALVKLEVLADSGEALNVEMSHDRFRSAALSKDDVVFVSLSDARIFQEDYSI
jgi:sulfate/thiosulfate transport system ATP-binding protein